MNECRWKTAVNFDVLWYWTHCDNIVLLARAVKHPPVGAWTSAHAFLLTTTAIHQAHSPSMQRCECVSNSMEGKLQNRTQCCIFIRYECVSKLMARACTCSVCVFGVNVPSITPLSCARQRHESVWLMDELHRPASERARVQNYLLMIFT